MIRDGGGEGSYIVRWCVGDIFEEELLEVYKVEQTLFHALVEYG